jgi:hypothetical protein
LLYLAKCCLIIKEKIKIFLNKRLKKFINTNQCCRRYLKRSYTERRKIEANTKEQISVAEPISK